jgi:hypothetical protein
MRQLVAQDPQAQPATRIVGVGVGVFLIGLTVATSACCCVLGGLSKRALYAIPHVRAAV